MRFLHHILGVSELVCLWAWGAGAQAGLVYKNSGDFDVHPG